MEAQDGRKSIFSPGRDSVVPGGGGRNRVLRKPRWTLIRGWKTETGKLRWRYDNEGNWVISSPAVADGLVITGNSDGESTSTIDARTGKEKWRRDTKINVFSSAIVSGGTAAIGDFYGKVWFLDLKTGEPKSVYYFEERVNA